jgi:hypothetical protein
VVTVETMHDIFNALRALDERRAVDRAEGRYDVLYATPYLEGDTLVTRWSDGLENRGKLGWNGQEWVRLHHCLTCHSKQGVMELWTSAVLCPSCEFEEHERG